MDTKHPNQLTLTDLKEALKMETVAETKEGITGLTGLMQDMLEALSATHDDVRYVRTTVTTLARSDAAHEVAIESLRKSLERVERKGGMAK
jgi:hypothetical protein